MTVQQFATKIAWPKRASGVTTDVTEDDLTNALFHGSAFHATGSGTKAGGKGYLENFLFPKAVAENVMRRGFTPPPE